MPHHVTHRGSRRSEVFLDEADRRLYIRLLNESCQRYLVKVWAYCLMSNHVHLVGVPERPDSFARAFHRANGHYSQLFNKKNGFVGHLWQERPFSCVLEGSHLWNAVRYVERNPVRAGLVGRAAEYPWSSARAHCNGQSDALLTDDSGLSSGIPNWREWLDEADDPDFGELIRERTFAGRPCGTDEFIHKVGIRTGRDLARRKRGPRRVEPQLIRNDPLADQ
jgi:putative transposase